mmetsp:Transcript_35558/g.36240  ORF Transcript_35558/g.36240 Transcript_35558/m.36240 type:complete len:517 (-) Transcript_35558:69-1619(-)
MLWSSGQIRLWFLKHRIFVAEITILSVFLLWGMDYNIIKYCLQHMSPFLFISFSYGFGLIFSIVGLYQHVKVKYWKESILVGLCMCSFSILQVFALNNTMISKTAFYATLDIPVTALIEFILFGKLDMNDRIGVVCSLLGAFLLSWDGHAISPNIGDWYSIAACIPSSIYFIACTHYSQNDSKYTLSLGQLIIPCLVCLILSPIFETSYVQWSYRLLCGLVVTGILSCGLAIYLLTWAQIYTSPTRTVIMGAPEPVFAAIVAYIVFGETFPSYLNIIGCILMIVGILSPVLFNACFMNSTVRIDHNIGIETSNMMQYTALPGQERVVRDKENEKEKKDFYDIINTSTPSLSYTMSRRAVVNHTETIINNIDNDTESDIMSKLDIQLTSDPIILEDALESQRARDKEKEYGTNNVISRLFSGFISAHPITSTTPSSECTDEISSAISGYIPPPLHLLNESDNVREEHNMLENVDNNVDKNSRSDSSDRSDSEQGVFVLDGVEKNDSSDEETEIVLNL